MGVEPTLQSKELLTVRDIFYLSGNDEFVDLNLGESRGHADWKSYVNNESTSYGSNRVNADGEKSVRIMKAASTYPFEESKKDGIVLDDLTVVGHATRLVTNPLKHQSHSNSSKKRRSRQIYRGEYKRTTPPPGRRYQGTKYNAKEPAEQENALITV